MHIVFFILIAIACLVYLFASEINWYEEAVGVTSTTVNFYGAAKAFNPKTRKFTVWCAMYYNLTIRLLCTII